MAIYAFWQRDKFRRKPEFRIYKDPALNYGLDGKRCGLFAAWLGLVVHIAPVDFIARFDRWPFRTISACGFSQHSDQGTWINPEAAERVIKARSLRTIVCDGKRPADLPGVSVHIEPPVRIS